MVLYGEWSCTSGWLDYGDKLHQIISASHFDDIQSINHSGSRMFKMQSDGNNFVVPETSNNSKEL